MIYYSLSEEMLTVHFVTMSSKNTRWFEAEKAVRFVHVMGELVTLTGDVA